MFGNNEEIVPKLQQLKARRTLSLRLLRLISLISVTSSTLECWCNSSCFFNYIKGTAVSCTRDALRLAKLNYCER